MKLRIKVISENEKEIKELQNEFEKDFDLDTTCMIKMGSSFEFKAKMYGEFNIVKLLSETPAYSLKNVLNKIDEEKISDKEIEQPFNDIISSISKKYSETFISVKFKVDNHKFKLVYSDGHIIDIKLKVKKIKENIEEKSKYESILNKIKKIKEIAKKVSNND